MQNLSALFSAFYALGCRHVLVKRLRANDNSKQQVYFGGSFEVLTLLPVVDILPHATGTYRAPLSFSWLHEDGTTLEQAPGAQLILYPQYPEVRFSGFLTRTRSIRARIMVPRQEGRLLFMGIREDDSQRRIIGYVTDAQEAITSEFIGTHGSAPDTGVFKALSLCNVSGGSSQTRLLRTLAAIHHKSFIPGKRLNAKGAECAYTAPNGGGYTLEAELGIIPNGKAEPDYEGWEVKSYKVTSFARPNTGRITLMTPEPTGGLYKEQGAQAFVQRYGTGSTIPGRMDFATTHTVGKPNAKSGLTMQLIGYDATSGKITDADGYIALLDATGQLAASWDFSGLMKHWNRKHNQAAYVPYLKSGSPGSYHFSNRVRLAEGTDFLLLLQAFASGAAFYDPGIKVENSCTKPKVKARSQFRINTGNLHLLYHKMSEHDITSSG